MASGISKDQEENITIVFHNPHSIWFKENVYCFLNNVKSIKKYDFLFDLYYQDRRKIHVLVTKTDESKFFKGLLRLFNLPIFDFYAWVILNKLNPIRFKVYFNPNKIPANYHLFSFLYGNFTFSNIINQQNKEKISKLISEIKCKKFIHLSHYGYNTKIASQLSKLANIDYFISESNLSLTSNYFKYNFDWYTKNVIVLPFVPQARFKKIKNFKDRKNIALSTGSNTHRMQDEGFINFFKTDLLQPLRKEISDNSQFLSSEIDSMINNMQASNDLKSLKKNNVLNFIFGDFINLFKIFSGKSQNKLSNEPAYYRVDIVDKYNQYKMFVVPEEIIGLPGIGFVEGMACGCAYIGLEHEMYTNLGLIPGRHYITYDGTLHGLKKTINYYQENPEELENIASNGYEFVRNNFNEEKVYYDFLKNLNK